MPYEITEESTGVYVRHSGFSAPFEILEITAWEAENINDHHAYMIVDLSDVDADTVAAWTTDILQRVAEDETVKLPPDYLGRPFKLAFVSDSELMKALLQSFIDSSSRPNHDLAIFRTVKQARAWVAAP
ncbi:MAG: hypothetical protein CMM77_08610 [Rhodospirillaceae bacterium]|nr:hypothetical protein [Magnetovibrio sp.]MAY67174.1 hypothetical protein [Rhodospirillaceae bacterium]|tara:strand:+ start:384 stop:770 length:387 start_codon:yes stop_codon:yes gene_type:complete